MPSDKLRSDLREAYDKYARERDASPLAEWKMTERSRFLSALRQENKARLLEVGAGPGHDSKYFQDQGLDVVCIDLSPVMVDLCRQKSLTAYVMDMFTLDLPEDSFDAVYSMNSLLHLPKQEFPQVLRRMNALLRAAGLVYLGIYGGSDFEGIREKDTYVPKRFFSFFSDEHLEQEVTEIFDILSFNRVFFDPDDPDHFQALILRKRSPDPAKG